MHLPWLEPNYQQLKQLLQHMPHAVLIKSGQFLGAQYLLNQAAHTLLCQQPYQNYPNFKSPCMQCKACHLYIHHNHVDYLNYATAHLNLNQTDVDSTSNKKINSKKNNTSKQNESTLDVEKAPKTETLGIEIMPSIEQLCQQTSYLGGNKVIAIDCKQLSLVAMQALLKLLEEPPKHTYFLLLEDSWVNFLPKTIYSRCITLKINTPTYEQVKEWLQENAQSIPDSLKPWLMHRPLFYKYFDAKLHSNSIDALTHPYNWHTFVKQLPTQYPLNQQLIYTLNEWLHMIYLSSCGIDQHSAKAFNHLRATNLLSKLSPKLQDKLYEYGQLLAKQPWHQQQALYKQWLHLMQFPKTAFNYKLLLNDFFATYYLALGL